MKQITAFDYLTPLNDEDPLGVFEFEPLATELTDAMQAIRYDQDDENEQIQAVHTRNTTARDYIVRCVNERESLLALLQQFVNKVAQWPEGANPEFLPMMKQARQLLEKEQVSA